MADRVLVQPAPPRGDRHPVDQAGGVDSSRSSARLQRPSGTPLVAGSSQAIALTSMTTAEGKRRDRPGRLRSLNPERPSWLNRLRHFDTVLTATQAGRDLDVLLCLGGEHDPGPEDGALLRGRPAQPALQPRRSVAVRVTVNGLGRLTSG